MVDARGHTIKLGVEDIIKLTGIAVSLLAVVVIPFALWMTSVHTDIHDLKRDMADVKQAVSARTKVAVSN